MLDLKFIVTNTKEVEESLRKRNMEKALPCVHEILSLDKERKEALQKVEALKYKRNNASQEVAKIKKQGGNADAMFSEMKVTSQEIKEWDLRVSEIHEAIRKCQYEIPNILDASVPEGGDAAANVVMRTWGTPSKLAFTPRSHFDIGEKLDIFDFKKAGEVAGSRFVYLKGMGARVERALIQLMLDTHGEAGYTEFFPPVLVNRNALLGTGQLPKFEEDVFQIEKYDLFLSPTAEVQITNYHRDEILEMKTLTRKYVAYSPCFRSEAGSYGKDTKGLKRQHQFNKIELVKFARAEDSAHELETLTQDAEKILQKLGLHYRVVSLCSGDLGFGSAKTYDIEVWSPFINGYMEISSCSNFFDYQARRANIRVKNPDTGKVEFVHTLNGSGLAVGRTLLALMENYQTEDGNFTLPEALKVYLCSH